MPFIYERNAMPALDGIRVLDFTQVIFGPAATQVLAEHGAEVIKIERPGLGDLARAFGPWHQQAGQEQSLPFASLNRNKKSLVIDLKKPAALEIVHRLLEKTDVLAHNFRSGAVMEKLGLDYAALKERYPRLIYAVGSGYGSKGPYVDRNKGGHESMAQALSGVAARFSGPNNTPQRLPYTIADFTGGMLLAQGVLLALMARERSGEGQYLETSLLDGMMSMQAWTTSKMLNQGDDGEDDGSGGASHPRGNPLDGAVFRTQDGCLMVTALFRPHEILLRDLTEALDIESLISDPRFASLELMKDNRQALWDLLAPIFAGRTSAEWITRLEAKDILVAPVRGTAEALADEQLQINGLLVEVEHPQLGRMQHVGSPLRLSGTPAAPAQAAPLAGEHSGPILAAAGYSQAEIEEFTKFGIIS
jgi:crotonobetainyl-CoA:carnitine CoA-transferase CaiB-like acyl-CoA transferase